METKSEFAIAALIAGSISLTFSEVTSTIGTESKSALPDGMSGIVQLTKISSKVLSSGNLYLFVDNFKKVLVIGTVSKKLGFIIDRWKNISNSFWGSKKKFVYETKIESNSFKGFKMEFFCA